MTRATIAIRRYTALTLTVLALAACRTASPKFDVARAPVMTTTTTTTTTTAARQATTTTPRATATTSLPGALDKLTGSQAIVVTAPEYGVATATLTAYERTSKGWTTAFGPWAANVGKRGVAPAGAKREGDLRTPSGTYGFDFMFGVNANPGVKFAFRRITGPNIVWVENPASPRYNEWIDSNEFPDEADEDNMYKPTAYAYGAVIAYNTAERTPGLGSGIFMHVAGKGATVGCVSVQQSQLLVALRWLDPAAHPVIVISAGSS